MPGHACGPLAWLLALVALPGCGAEAAPPELRTLAAGEAVLAVADAPGLRLFGASGQELLRFEADGFQLGLLPQVDDVTNYDPYRLYEPHPLYTVSDDLGFVAPAEARFVGGEPGELRLALGFPGGARAELRARVGEAGRFDLALVPTAALGAIAYLRLRPRASAAEGFYGLGEQLDHVDQRGAVRAMQLELGGPLEGLNNEAHVPVPLVVGTRGWGMFVPSPYAGAFAVARDADQAIEATFGTGPASGDGLGFHLFAAAHPLDLTRHYYALTGFPGLPARWALGPLVWRDENDDQAQVESDAETMRALDLAATGYWIDRPYATAVNTFDFEAARFPDPAAMVAKLHALGLRTALWHTPYLDEESPDTAALRAEAEAAGYYPPERGVLLNGWGPPIDLTNPAAVAWWRSLLGAYAKLGFEGFKLDYAEDVVVGPTTKRIVWRFADGSDERTAHQRFPYHYHETYAPLLPEGGGLLLCRAGTWGDQIHGPIIWPGDLDASLARQGDEAVDADGNEYVAVGGLPASLVAALSLGPSGFPFFGSDTGGYRHCPPDNETFSRWFEQTALSTVMQIGTSCNDVAWEPTAANGFDAALLDRYRYYVRLHLRLFPYLWSYAERLAEDGRPIMRPLGLAYPELGAHPDDTYLLGDELLVAPVVERGAKERAVLFPPGAWVHWLTSERFAGPGEQIVDAPLGRLPLFLRGDGLVPLLRPSIDALAPTTAPDQVDSYATSPGLLFVRAVAGGDGAFALFDGGRVAQESSAGTSVLTVEAGNELAGGVVFELLAAPEPAAVTLAGEPLAERADQDALAAAADGWLYEPAGETLWVKLPAGATQATVSYP